MTYTSYRFCLKMFQRLRDVIVLVNAKNKLTFQFNSSLGI